MKIHSLILPACFFSRLPETSTRQASIASLTMRLIERFLGREIPATEFERLHLDQFMNETEWFGGETFDILQGVFSAADEFCADPALRSGTSLDEEQLREECQAALEKLRELIN